MPRKQDGRSPTIWVYRFRWRDDTSEITKMAHFCKLFYNQMLYLPRLIIDAEYYKYELENISKEGKRDDRFERYIAYCIKLDNGEFDEKEKDEKRFAKYNTDRNLWKGLYWIWAKELQRMFYQHQLKSKKEKIGKWNEEHPQMIGELLVVKKGETISFRDTIEKLKVGDIMPFLDKMARHYQDKWTGNHLLENRPDLLKDWTGTIENAEKFNWFEANPWNKRVTESIIKAIRTDFSNTFKSFSAWKKNPESFLGRPGFPNFKRDYYMTFSVDNRDCEIVRGKAGLDIVIKIRSGTKILKNGKKRNIYDRFVTIPVPEMYNDLFLEGRFTDVKFAPLNHKYFDISIGYERRNDFTFLNGKRSVLVVIPNPSLDYGRYLGIDFGDRIICGCVTNFENKPFLLDSSKIHEINEWKKVARARVQSKHDKRMHPNGTRKGDKPPYRQINAIEQKRKRVIDTELHAISNCIVQFCVRNKIGNIVYGYSKDWKQNTKKKAKEKTAKKGKESAGGFYYKDVRRRHADIPHSKLIHQITYKAQANGINMIAQEEGYTSMCSAFDKEPIEWHKKYLGMRGNGKNGLPRALFRTATGIVVHSDINGATNILRLVIGDSFLDSEEFRTPINPTKTTDPHNPNPSIASSLQRDRTQLA